MKKLIRTILLVATWPLTLPLGVSMVCMMAVVEALKDRPDWREFWWWNHHWLAIPMPWWIKTPARKNDPWAPKASGDKS